ncbi:conserved hypothetical protein [Histoplasma capsulatum H143]|uniref:Reverse transcriptase domain-containing protein n=1 Tax=Ajellomyces capsulatus (strain H143) TaxID=544712 RepID=C6HPM9_AJECH|nr:conserved hypothetical protein [Histoplasma capsulatum H143]
MSTTAALPQALQSITATKITELKKQRALFESRKSALLKEANSQTDLRERVRILLEGVTKIQGFPSDGLDTSDKDDAERDWNDSSRFLFQSKYDSSISSGTLSSWEEELKRALDLRSVKHEHALFFSQLVTEWLTNPNDPAAEEGTEGQSEHVGREEMHEQRAEWESGVISSGIFSPDKVVILKGFLENEDVAQEVADVLNMRLAQLDTWKWGSEVIPLEMRRQLNGKYRVYMDEDVLDALFLHYLGVQWGVKFKGIFGTFFNSHAWKRNAPPIPKRDLERRQYFLHENPKGDNGAQANLYKTRRETFERSYFMSQLPSTQSQTPTHYATWENNGIKIWLNFFKTFLEAPVRFVNDGPDAPARIRRRGVPMSHSLSDFLGEVLLFCMDYSASKSADGAFLYRLHDDFWFWGQEKLCVRAWGAMTEFSEVMGIEFNEEKTGTARLIGKNPRSSHQETSSSESEGEDDGGADNMSIASSGSDINNNALPTGDRFNVHNLPDGVFYFPVELGGLDLRNPLIPFLAIRENMRKTPEKTLEKAFIEDEKAYSAAKEQFEKHGPDHTGNFVLNTYRRRHGGRDGSSSPSYKAPETFMSLEEFNKYTETTSRNLVLAYQELLVCPEQISVNRTPELMSEQSRLDDSPDEKLLPISSSWHSMNMYWKWVAELYCREMAKRYGGLAIVERGVVPLGVLKVLREGKISPITLLHFAVD